MTFIIPFCRHKSGIVIVIVPLDPLRHVYDAVDGWEWYAAGGKTVGPPPITLTGSYTPV